jgi:hypothetical protein
LESNLGPSPSQPPKPYWTVGNIAALILVVVLIVSATGFAAFNYLRQNSPSNSSSNTCSNGATNYPNCDSCASNQHYATGQCRNGDFSMTPIQPTPVWVQSYATSTVSVTATSDFTGSIGLSDTSVPGGLTCIMSQTNLTSRGATVMVLCTASFAGNYYLTIMGTSGVLTHSVSLTITVQDFSVSVSQPQHPDALNSGQTVNSTVTVTALNGFAGSVVLSGSFPGISVITCVVSSSVIANGSGTVILSCKHTLNVVISGTIQLVVTGSSGSLGHTASVFWTL